MMADIETSIVISANTDDLQSGMEAAANSVQAATDAIRAQFTGLGAAAQQVQLQISTASAEVGSSIGALQARAAGLAGSIGDRLIPSSSMVGTARNERDQLNQLSADEKVTDAKFANYKALIDGEAAHGQISVNEQIRQEQELLDLKWSYDQAYYEKKLEAAQDDTRTQEKLIEEQALAYEKYVGQVQTLDTKLVEANQKVWDGLVAPVERAIDTSVTGIILGTTTVQKALANLAQSIIAEFVNSAVKGVFGQIGSLFGASLVAGGGGDQDFSGGLTGAGGIFGSLFEGIGALLGFERGGIVPSAQGGWAVPSLGPGGVLAQLHSNEMVLPADLSSGLQEMIRTGGGGQPVVINISAIDSQDVRRFFTDNGAL